MCPASPCQRSGAPRRRGHEEGRVTVWTNRVPLRTTPICRDLLDSDTSARSTASPSIVSCKCSKVRRKPVPSRSTGNTTPDCSTSKRAARGAETKNFTGEEAAHLILSWHETVVQLRYFNGQRKRQINKPLISIIMEAFRLRSEREKRQQDNGVPQKKSPAAAETCGNRRQMHSFGNRLTGQV